MPEERIVYLTWIEERGCWGCVLANDDDDLDDPKTLERLVREDPVQDWDSDLIQRRDFKVSPNED